MLKPGLYEKVVSQRIREELAAVPAGRKEANGAPAFFARPRKKASQRREKTARAAR